MGQLATDIHDAAAARIPAAPATDPANLTTGPQLLQVFAAVEQAVSALELLTRGAHIVRTAGPPDDAADGADGDLGLNTLTADLYGKAGGVWVLLFNLKGPAGTNATGTTGLDAYQLALQQGFSGSLDQWLASLGRAGAAGPSAYQVAVAGGFVGSVGAWLVSLKGLPGAPGARGNTVVDRSYAPTTEPGQDGDTWYHALSAQKFARYVYATGAWSLRFTSPDPATGTGGSAGVASFNTRTGAVALAAQDVFDVMRGTTTVTFALVGGKLELTAAGGGASLPDQTGQDGKFLKTMGGVTSWAMVPSGYSDNQAKAAAGNMATQSATIAPVFDSTGLTLQFGVRPASLDASHFSPLFVSDGVFSSANKTKLETAGNWNGVSWNGVGSQELTGSRKFDTHVDATYFYINIAPDNPIRLARA